MKYKLCAIFLIILTSFFFLNNSFSQVDSSQVSLDLKDVELKDALKIISQASGYNIVLDNDVKVKVSVSLKEVPWQTALDVILKSNGLTHRIQNNIIRVMTLMTVQKEGETTPLETKIFSLNFAKADSLQKSLAKMLSSRGTIEIDIPTNSLIITDSPENLNKLEEISKNLDRRTPQVMIEALIVSVKLTDTTMFGITWTATDKSRSERTAVQNLAATQANLALTYGKTIMPDVNFNALMNIYSQDKNVHILANPRILTLDNLAAQIEILEQVSYQSSTATEQGTTVSTQFKDVGIKLYVTPHITKDRFILLSAKAEQSYVAAYTADNQPAIDSRKAETNFILKDSETVVIGGLRKKDNTTTIYKIPFLGDLPLLGRLFRRDTKEINETELIIFITPHIVDDTSSSLTSKENDKLSLAKEELSREVYVSKQLEKEAKKQELKNKNEEIKKQKEIKNNELKVIEQNNKEQKKKEPKKIIPRQDILKAEAESAQKLQADKTKTEEKQKINKLYTEALLRYKNRRYLESKALFEEIIKINPQEKKAKAYLGKKIPEQLYRKK